MDNNLATAVHARLAKLAADFRKVGRQVSTHNPLADLCAGESAFVEVLDSTGGSLVDLCVRLTDRQVDISTTSCGDYKRVSALASVLPMVLAAHGDLMNLFDPDGLLCG